MGVQKGATYIGNISYSKTKAFLPTLRIPSRNSIQPHPTMASDFYMNKSPATLLLIIISTPRCTIFSKTFRNTVISLPETFQCVLPTRKILNIRRIAYGTWTGSNLSHHLIFLRMAPLVKFKESFRLSHRACADPHFPRRNTIHSVSACPRYYCSHCLLPNRLASHYIGQGPRDLLPGPLSRQHHRSFLGLKAI